MRVSKTWLSKFYTALKFSPCLSNRFATGYDLCLGNGKMVIMLDYYV